MKNPAKNKVRGESKDTDRAGKSIGKPAKGSLAHNPDGSHIDTDRHDGKVNPVVFERTPTKKDEGIVDASASVTTQLSKP